MRKLVFIYLLTSALWGQTGKFGAFTNSEDIGAPPLKGSNT